MGKITISTQQEKIRLAKLTLVNILNCPNGIIRRQYENKLKQKENMPDQTLDEIRIVQENNKARLYEKKKKMRNVIDELLLENNSDEIISYIMQQKEEN